MIKYSYFTFAFLLLTAINSFSASKTYYLSSSKGNNNNSGTDQQHPWKTIERLNKQKLAPGNTVLFKCNDVFFGEITVKQSGTKNLPITFSAYGKGAKPIISGAIKINNFTRFNDNIWQSKCPQDVKSFYNKDQLQTLARYPNSGFAIMQNGVNNSITFIDSALNQKPGYWENANLRFRTWDWEVRNNIVKKFEDYKVTITDSSTNNLGKGWGYYFDNKFEELDTLGEWFYNPTKKMLYYYGGSNFTPNNSEVVTLNCGIKLNNAVSYININNLSIQKFDDYGITLSKNNSNIVIENNLINNINHTGVFVNQICKNTKISKNEILNINGRGIYALEPENLLVNGNNIHHIGLKMGYGVNGVNGMVGITITNNEVLKNAQSHTAIHNRIINNKVENVGYVGIRMDGAYSLMQNNIVNNVLLKLSDGAAIYCWAKSKYFTHHNIIKNNVVYNVSGSNYGTPSGPIAAANGIYLDNLVYNVSVIENTVYNISATGIHINSDAYNNMVTKNVVYNCKSALGVAEWAKPASTFNNSFFNNTVVLTQPNQRGAFLINWLLPNTKNMANFNNNFYYSLHTDTLTEDLYNVKNSVGENIQVNNRFTFNNWKSTYGYESDGAFTNLNPLMQKGYYPQLITNTTKVTKLKSFKNEQTLSLEGNLLKSFKLAPFESRVILIKK